MPLIAAMMPLLIRATPCAAAAATMIFIFSASCLPRCLLIFTRFRRCHAADADSALPARDAPLLLLSLLRRYAAA